jgi:hypothetical protein
VSGHDFSHAEKSLKTQSNAFIDAPEAKCLLAPRLSVGKDGLNLN